MGRAKKRPVYCYKIKTGEFFEFESIYSAAQTLLGEYKHSYKCGIRTSIDSPKERKLSSKGYLWFDKKEGVDIVRKEEIYCAMNYRYQTMNHKGQVNWKNLSKAHQNRKTPVIAYNENGEEIFYNSMVEAAADFDTPKSNIARVLTNQNKGDSDHHSGKKRLTAAGWYFRYA